MAWCARGVPGWRCWVRGVGVVTGRVGASLAVAREASAEAALFDVVLRVCVGGVWRAVSCEGVLQRLPFDVT